MNDLLQDLRSLARNRCVSYTVLSILYALDAMTTWPSALMAAVLICQIMADVAEGMDMRGTDVYANQSRKCAASCTFFGNLMAVVLASVGIIFVGISLFMHVHQLHFTGRFFPLIFYLLSIFRVRTIVQETQREREVGFIAGLAPQALLRTTSLDNTPTANRFHDKESAKNTTPQIGPQVSTNPPGYIQSPSLRQKSDAAINQDRPVSAALKQYFYGQEMAPRQPGQQIPQETPHYPNPQPSRQANPFEGPASIAQGGINYPLRYN